MNSPRNPSTKVLGYFHLVRFADDTTPTLEAKFSPAFFQQMGDFFQEGFDR